MRIQDSAHLHPAFDVANGLGHILIQTGLAERVTLICKSAIISEFLQTDGQGARPKLKNNTVWRVFPTRVSLDRIEPPQITAQCNCTSDSFIFAQPDAESRCWLQHQSNCDGGTERPPQTIIDEYSKFRRIYEAQIGASETIAKSDPLARMRAELRKR